MVTFDWQFVLSHFTSISQSKCPMLHTIASSSIWLKCTSRIISLHPVADTNILASFTASSTVVTSYPSKAIKYVKRCKPTEPAHNDHIYYRLWQHTKSSNSHWCLWMNLLQLRVRHFLVWLLLIFLSYVCQSYL